MRVAELDGGLYAGVVRERAGGAEDGDLATACGTARRP